MPRARKGESAAPTIECPRCGYDVSGTMSTWTSECPVEGRCSECGYAFQWKHLLGPNLGVPKWFFETAQRRLIQAAISTSVRTLVPWHFWKRVPLHAPVNVARFVWIVVSAVIGAYGVGVLALLMEPLSHTLGTQPVIYQWTHVIPTGGTLTDRFSVLFLTFLGPAMRWPVDDETWRLAAPLGRVIAWLLLSILLMPLCFMAISRTLRTHRVRRMHVVRMAAYAVTCTCVVFASWLIAACAWLWITEPPSFSREKIGQFREQVGLGALWLWWPAVLALWWWSACHSYLRIRNAFLVAMLLQLMATSLAYLLVFPFIDGGTWTWLVRP